MELQAKASQTLLDGYFTADNIPQCALQSLRLIKPKSFCSQFDRQSPAWLNANVCCIPYLPNLSVWGSNTHNIQLSCRTGDPLAPAEGMRFPWVGRCDSKVMLAKQRLNHANVLQFQHCKSEFPLFQLTVGLLQSPFIANQEGIGSKSLNVAHVNRH